MPVGDPNAQTRARFGGQAILVTGAGGHLGSAIALGIARDGGTPILNGRTRETLELVQGRLREEGLACRLLVGDVADETRMGLLLEEAVLDFAGSGTRLSGIVNNAFAGQVGDEDVSFAELYGRAAQINLGAAANLIEKFAQLCGDQGGSIVNVSSMYAQVSPDPEMYCEGIAVNPPYYGATKAGLEQLTRYYAVALAPRGIRVNSVSPGPFPRPEVVADHPEFARRLAARCPMKRLGSPKELYPAVAFLLSQEASFVTGANVNVDGGWTAI